PVSAPPPSGPRLLTYPELRARKGIPFSRSELRRRELKGTFPRHITLGEGFEPLDRVDRERGRRLHRCPDGGATRVRRSRAARRASRPRRNEMADKEEFQADTEDNKKKPKQADILIGLAQSAELFHSADDTGFADLDINGHRETWPTRAKGFRRWLARRFFEATQGAPSSEALQSALNVIEARAYFDAPEGVPAAGEALGARRSAIPRNEDRGWGQSAFRGIGARPQALEQRRPYPSDFQGRLRGRRPLLLQPAQL